MLSGRHSVVGVHVDGPDVFDDPFRFPGE